MSKREDVRQRFSGLMPFIDAMSEAFGGDVKVTHIKNNQTGDEMETALNKEPNGGVLDAEQFLSLGRIENICDIETRKAEERARRK